MVVATCLIYQMVAEEIRNYPSLTLRTVKKYGGVNPKAYTCVYRLDAGGRNHLDMLKKLYVMFNTTPPLDYTGRLMSTGDIVVVNYEGIEVAFYCDSRGWVEIPFKLK